MALVNPSINQQALFAYRCYNTTIPRQNPKGVYCPLDFTNTVTGSNGTDINIDLELIHELSRLDFVQTVYIDNSLSGQRFTLTADHTNHSVSMLAGRQGFVPMIAIGGEKFLASTGGKTTLALIKVQFLNHMIQPYVWQAS